MGASLSECRLWSTCPRPPDGGRLICCLLCISQSKSIWNHSQIGSDRWWSSQADWSACSQKSGCSMKLAPSVLKHHRTPSDFVARFAGICSAPIKAVCSALRVILILVYNGKYKDNLYSIMQQSISILNSQLTFCTPLIKCSNYWIPIYQHFFMPMFIQQIISCQIKLTWCTFKQIHP